MNTKFKYLIFILLVPLIVFSQDEDKLIIEKGICVEKGIYVYNNSKDTLKLSTDCNFWGDTLCHKIEVFKEISIGNPNERGIVFFSSCEVRTEMHGGTFDISRKAKFTKYEIWNLKTKELLFESINTYHCYFDENLVGFQHSKGTAFYQYDFMIDNNGKIIINNLKSKLSFSFGKRIRGEVFKPDNEEGIYELVDGKYTKIE